jgi:hypothetical protein
MAQSYADMKADNGKVVALAPRPRSTATPKELEELAAKYVPDNAANYYTPASALDENLHGGQVGDLISELWNRQHDSARAFDVGMGRGAGEGEVFIALPGENVSAAPTEPIFTSPQKRVADYYAQKRAAQTGQDPHAEMLMVDPFAGKNYGHITMGSGAQEPITTRARRLMPEDVQEVTQLYADGGRVTNPDQMTHKPQAKTANPLQSLARGWAAGTAGLPGDLEGLARMALRYGAAPGSYVDRNLSETPALPTSDFYREWLPGGQTGIGADDVESLGSMLGGVGSTLPAKGAVKVAKVAARNAMVPSTLSREAGVVKLPGGNWLRGSVEDSLTGLKKTMKRPDRVGQHVVTDEMWNDYLTTGGGAVDNSLNNWIDKQLTRYVKNDMATPGDPIRALAEKGPIHVNLNFEGNPRTGRIPRAERRASGFPDEGLAQEVQAKGWENVADNYLDQRSAGQMIGNGGGQVSDRIVEQNPWLTKVPPETRVNAPYDWQKPKSLGFDHLIDELRNATDPTSGLPPELLLKYSSLPQVSVPQAVERVAKINAWREAKAAEANAAKANNAATVLHKDYPEHGLKWVELKHQGEDAPFQDAVLYEGGAMGHSVGGYASEGGYGVGGLQAARDGRVKLYSLRDSKGTPHVTIEMSPGAKAPEGSLPFGGLNPDIQEALRIRGLAPSPNSQPMMYSPEGKALMVPIEDRILQIKGKSNRKPNDEYLPYVQDFVKSGQWSDVGDLQNTGLYRVNKDSLVDLAGYTPAPEDLRLPRSERMLGISRAYEKGLLPEDGYVTRDEWEGALRKTLTEPGYASGGLVAPKVHGYNRPKLANPRAKQNPTAEVCSCR